MEFAVQEFDVVRGRGHQGRQRANSVVTVAERRMPIRVEVEDLRDERRPEPASGFGSRRFLFRGAVEGTQKPAESRAVVGVRGDCLMQRRVVTRRREIEQCTRRLQRVRPAIVEVLVICKQPSTLHVEHVSEDFPRLLTDATGSGRSHTEGAESGIQSGDENIVVGHGVERFCDGIRDQFDAPVLCVGIPGAEDAVAHAFDRGIERELVMTVAVLDARAVPDRVHATCEVHARLIRNGACQVECGVCDAHNRRAISVLVDERAKLCCLWQKKQRDRTCCRAIRALLKECSVVVELACGLGLLGDFEQSVDGETVCLIGQRLVVKNDHLHG